MSLDSLPPHILRPHLRPIQPLPLVKDGQKYVALRDMTALSVNTMVLPAPAVQALQFFRGEESLDSIAAKFSAPVEQFVDLANRMDELGLLWGPTFERLEKELHEKLRKQGTLPAGAAMSMGEDEATARARIEEYFAQTDDPELEQTPIGIITPHLDYERGWPNYAAAYYPLRNMAKPDRVVVLGTNHHGIGDGVVMCEYGFVSPFGNVRVDADVLSRMTERFGRSLTVDQLDHIPEHSIQLQLPWIQYCFGDVPVVAALVPDPLVPMLEDNDERVTFERFVPALSEALAEAGGTTFFVASSDLSHVGPQFGEPRRIDDQRRIDVETHDREMMAKFLTGDPEEFLGAMRWNNNPTRWCSIGNMAATLMLARPATVELIDYRQACDDEGTTLVSSAAMALM